MKIIKSLSILIIFIFSLFVFMPKQNLYYFAEKQLKQYDVILNDEIFVSHIFGFELKDADVYVQGVNIATLDRLDISLFKGVKIFSKDIGNANLELDISNQSVIVWFTPTQAFIRKYQIINQYFKKDKDGRLKYEYKIF